MSNPYGQYVPDELAPSGWRWRRHDEVEPTRIGPAVAPSAVQALHGDDEERDEAPQPPEHPGGDWANPDAYLSYDDVDSTTVIDDGAPR